MWTFSRSLFFIATFGKAGLQMDVVATLVLARKCYTAQYVHHTIIVKAEAEKRLFGSC